MTCRSEALEGLQRVVALLPAHGAAAGWIDARSASVWPRPPRAPRSRKAPPKDGGQPAQGAPRHRFSLSRETVARADSPDPGISAVWGGVLLDSTKGRTAFATFALPRDASISPRISSFLPRVCFWSGCPLSPLSLSLLRGGGRKKEGGEERARHPRVQDVTRGYKPYGSGKKRAFHGISGDRYEPFIQWFQWVSEGGPRSPGFSVEMPLSPRVVVVPGGVDGVR